MDRQQLRPKIVGQLHRRLRGGHAGLEGCGIPIAPAGGKAHSRDPQPEVVEPLANLPQARAADLVGREPVSPVYLHAINTEAMGNLQAVTKVSREPHG